MLFSRSIDELGWPMLVKGRFIKASLEITVEMISTCILLRYKVINVELL